VAQLMRTSNPVLNEKGFAGFATVGERMTLQGTVNKTGILLLCAMASAAWTWHLFMQSRSAADVLPYLLVLLLAYRSGLIPVTQNFRLGIVAATGAIMLFYLLEFVLGFFGIHFSSINGSGPIGIGFSLIIVGIAALNLVLDFDFIENGARMGAPKYMEWYGAFGLMVTLVWLYLEILRLLTKIRGRD
jgi:uncharacterized YccA/Bax inhibitor family protein